MFKIVFIIPLIVLTFTFSGCDSDSEGESRLETQGMLDDRDYQGVISKLAGANVKTDEESLALGAAYMGRAGLSLSDLVKVVSESGDDDNAFGAFISSIAEATKDSKSPLVDLTKATVSYDEVLDGVCSDNNLSDSQKDLCIFKGLTQVMGTATTMSYIAEDIGSVFDSKGDRIDSKLTASTCAMQYAIDSNTIGTDCSDITDNGTITFETGNSYKSIDVIVDNAEVFEYLISGESTVITKGYCTTESFQTRVDDESNLDHSFHVCPINEELNATELTTGAVLADALNNGVDSIGVAADDDMKEDIDEFKSEVLESSGKSPDETITEEDVVNYLNEQNQ
ncbi:MAG: hypothetical protein U9P38_00715 [Campylobacterota bacterium]|nr:hypothetical protein [Campylobacterota bacterium]